MDTKRLFTTILIAGALMLLFNSFFKKDDPAAGGPVKAPYALYTGLPEPTPPSTGPAVPGKVEAAEIVLGNATQEGHTLALTVNTRTAGIQRAQLNIHNYAETFKHEKPLTLFEGDPALPLPFATTGVQIRFKRDDGLLNPELDYRFAVGEEKPTAQSLVPYVPGGSTPITPATTSAPATNPAVEIAPAATGPAATVPATSPAVAVVAPHVPTQQEFAQHISDVNSTLLLKTQRIWTIESQTPDKLELSLQFSRAGAPVAKVIKTFEVDPKSYEVAISYRVENLSDKPLEVAIDQLGPSELPRDDPQADDRFFHALGLNTDNSLLDASRWNTTQVELQNLTRYRPAGTKYIGHFNTYDKVPILWVASSNRFFAVIVRPKPSVPSTVPAPTKVALKDGTELEKVTHIERADLDLLRYSDTPSDTVAVVRFTGAFQTIDAHGTLSEPLSVYMGPKKRENLDGSAQAAVGTEDFAHHAYSYTSIIQLKQGGCYSLCTFDFLAIWILKLLEFFVHSVAFGNYGVAIMILVIVVRAAMHPLTRASQINMAKMSNNMKKLKPQLDASKRRYEGDKKKQQEDMMRIYRENKVNPAGGLLGCLPMLIQMPIWAALWSGLRTDIDLRHASFIPGWINDLSHPDTILPNAIPTIGHPLFTLPLLGDIYGLNLLPLLLTAVFFFQMKVNSASQPPPADEQQAKMQKMSQYMIFIFPLFLYSAPSGLNLYIFASTMGGLLDTWLVRKSLRKQGILPTNAPALPLHEEKPA